MALVEKTATVGDVGECHFLCGKQRQRFYYPDFTNVLAQVAAKIL